MIKIGMIVAVETHAIFEKYGTLKSIDAPSGFELFEVDDHNVKLFFILSFRNKLITRSYGCLLNAWITFNYFFN